MAKCGHAVFLALLAIILLIGDILSIQSVKDIGREDLLVSDSNPLENRLSQKIHKLVQDAKTSTNIPPVGIDLRFYLPLYLYHEIGIIGYTGSWSHYLLASPAIEDDFTIEFINVDGDFSAKLRIQASQLNIQGKYRTDLRNIPSIRGTPNMTFNGDGRYDMSLNSFDLVLQVEGQAPPVGNVSIISAKISVDFKNPDVNFTNLALISQKISGWDTMNEWVRTVESMQDIHTYFWWDWKHVVTFLGIDDVVNEMTKCVLQNFYRDCSLMDLIHSDECIKSQIELSCLNKNELQVFLPNINDYQNGIYAKSVPLSSNKMDELHRFEVKNEDEFELSLLNTQLFNPTVKNLANKFASKFRSDGNKNGWEWLKNSNASEHIVSSMSPLNLDLDNRIIIPDIETQVMYRNQEWDSFGGFLRIRNSSATGVDGQEDILTDFVDENGTFVVNYSITFPLLTVSGYYETDLTLYLSSSLTMLGQGRLFGSGDYNWEIKNVSLKISAAGLAPIGGASKITVSSVTVEMSHENHYTRRGLNFTNMTDELWSYNGTLGMHVRPYNWHQVIQDHRFLVEDFFYNVRYDRPPLENTFKDSVAQQLQCVLNYTLNGCTILELLFSRDCLRVDGNDECFGGPSMSVAPLTTIFTTEMQSVPPETTTTNAPTTTTTTPESTWITEISSTIGHSTPTQKPELPNNVGLLLNQTQILLDQAQILLQLVQAEL